ncbi:MAG TPA: NAD(P)H-dependent oxidoreductase [Bryobacteraceae bacterium]|nr:NAD(P)H-dependent oxidoreductase [Bryobacteraceae bacterium]
MKRFRLAVIIGSTRKGRLGSTIAQWFTGVAGRREDVAVDVIDLAEARLPYDLSDERPAEVAAYARRVAEADAVVIVTPEYNHSFPAPLKNAIDWLREEWRRKPVGFVSYGGVSGGMLAVEQLRQVFAELQALTIRNNVAFSNVWAQFADGVPVEADRRARSANGMIDQLVWWADALAPAGEADRNLAA